MNRSIHPGAWWLWGPCVAAAATQSTNLLVLALLVAAVAVVVARCAPPDASLRVYVWVAFAVVVVRLGFRVILPSGEGTVLFTLRTVHLGPLDLFGPVTAEGLLGGLIGGLQVAAVILAVGAAGLLGDILEVLRHTPPALAGVSTAVVVAVSVFPELGRAVTDTRRAARLRGRRPGLRRTLTPVLESTMERSLALATALEARGYGAGGPTAIASRTAAGTTSIAALLLLAVAGYALFDSAWPSAAAPLLAMAAAIALAVSVHLTPARRRTVYRPRRWTGASLAVVAAGCGCLVLLALVPSAVRHPGPLLFPELTVLGLLAPVVAAAPALRPWRSR